MLRKTEGRRIRGREDEMVGWHHRLGGLDFEQALADGEGQGSLACSSPRGCKESDLTERLNNNREKEKVPWDLFVHFGAGVVCLVPVYKSWLLNFQGSAMQVLNTAIMKKNYVNVHWSYEKGSICSKLTTSWLFYPICLCCWCSSPLSCLRWKSLKYGMSSHLPVQWSWNLP